METKKEYIQFVQKKKKKEKSWSNAIWMLG